MPRIYQPEDIIEDPKPKIMALIAKLRPGQSYVMLELCAELGLSIEALKRVVPAKNKLVARVPGHHKPVILITCPGPSQPPPRTKRK